MAGKSDPKTTQGEPTAPRPVDQNGRTLDEYGLPLNGPARLAALDGKPDPRDAAPVSPPVDPATPPTQQD